MAFVILDNPGPGAYDPNIEASLPAVPHLTVACGRWDKKIPMGPGPTTYNIKRTFCTGPAFTIARRYPPKFKPQLPRPPAPPTKKFPRVYPPNKIIYGIGQIKYHEEEWKK